MHDPRDLNLAALKRILRYVHGALDFCLQVLASSTGSLIASSDVDRVGFPSNRRSTSDYCVFLAIISFLGLLSVNIPYIDIVQRLNTRMLPML